MVIVVKEMILKALSSDKLRVVAPQVQLNLQKMTLKAVLQLKIKKYYQVVSSNSPCLFIS